MFIFISLGVPTVNYGLHAALEIDYLLYLARKVLKRGDIVILPLEYRHFNYQGTPSKEKVCYVKTWDKAYFNQLTFQQQIQYLKMISFIDILKSIREQIINHSSVTDSYGMKEIKDFASWCNNNGIKMYVSFGAEIFFDEYKDLPYFKESQIYFQKNAINTLGSPLDFMYDRSLFYDTNNHLNNVGMNYTSLLSQK